MQPVILTPKAGLRIWTAMAEVAERSGKWCIDQAGWVPGCNQPAQSGSPIKTNSPFCQRAPR